MLSEVGSTFVRTLHVAQIAWVVTWTLAGPYLIGCDGKPTSVDPTPSTPASPPASASLPTIPPELLADRWLAGPGDAADAYGKAYEIYTKRTCDSEWTVEAAKLVQAGGRQAACDYTKIAEAFSQTTEDLSVRAFLSSLKLHARNSETRSHNALTNDLETALVILGWRMANIRSADASEEGIVAFAGIGIVIEICEPIRESARMRNEGLPWLDDFSTAMMAFFRAKKAEISNRLTRER